MARTKTKSEEFTELQLKFVYFYCADENKNGAEAARKAGYSEKTAKQKANTLLKDKRIRALIHAHEQLKQIETQVNPKNEVNAQFILQERIDILQSCKRKVPKMIWDYNEHKSVSCGEEMIDARSAALVLRDIEASLDSEDSNWTQSEKDKLFEILSK